MKDNKKKTLVLAILGVALIAVGAFQFLPKGGDSAAVAKASAKNSTSTGSASKGTTHKATAQGAGNDEATNSSQGEVAQAETDPQKAMLQMLVKDPLPPRDPFAPQNKSVIPVDPNNVQTAPTGVPAQTYHPPVANPVQRPTPMRGDVKPWEVLPNGGGPGNTTGSPTGIGLTQGAPLRQPGEFAYKLKGVLVGNKPMAVFEDDNGNQRLVPLGGSLDGDSKVVGIEKGKVRIRHRGKEETHNLPEGP